MERQAALKLQTFHLAFTQLGQRRSLTQVRSIAVLYTHIVIAGNKVRRKVGFNVLTEVPVQQIFVEPGSCKVTVVGKVVFIRQVCLNRFQWTQVGVAAVTVPGAEFRIVLCAASVVKGKANGIVCAHIIHTGTRQSLRGGKTNDLAVAHLEAQVQAGQHFEVIVAASDRSGHDSDNTILVGFRNSGKTFRTLVSIDDLKTDITGEDACFKIGLGVEGGYFFVDHIGISQAVGFKLGSINFGVEAIPIHAHAIIGNHAAQAEEAQISGADIIGLQS